jgi:hypothetical protein
MYPETLEYEALNGLPAVCEVRVYHNIPVNSPREISAIVVTDCGAGPSITNNIERIASVLKGNGLFWDVFIEHYPADLTGGRQDTFDLVRMQWATPQVAIQPRWKRIERGVAEGITGSRL